MTYITQHSNVITFFSKRYSIKDQFEIHSLQFLIAVTLCYFDILSACLLSYEEFNGVLIPVWTLEDIKSQYMTLYTTYSTVAPLVPKSTPFTTHHTLNLVTLTCWRAFQLHFVK